MPKIIALLFCVLVSGCVGMADYMPPPSYASDAKPVDPETLSVDAKAFPRFKLSKKTTPPRERSQFRQEARSNFAMEDILPSDVWAVKYVVGDLYLIVSDSYEQRLCKSIGCHKPPFSEAYAPNYLHAIFISRDGRVSGGWKFIKNPNRVVLSSERRTYLVPAPWGSEGWAEIRFETIQ